MPTVQELPAITSINLSDVLVGEHISTNTAGKISVQQIVDLVSAGVVTIDASMISAAGGIVDSQFSGLGYVKKTGTQSFTEVCVIPSSDITGFTLSRLTDVSVSSAAASTYLMYNGSQWIPTSVTGGGGTVDASSVAAAGAVMTSYVSGPIGYLRRTGTTAYIAVSTIPSTDVSGFSLSRLTDTSVGSAATNQFLRYNGTQWVPASVASSGGGANPAGSNTQIQYNNAGSFGATGQLTFETTTNTLFVGASATSDSGTITLGGSTVGTGTIAGANLAFKTNAVQRMSINNAGNVLINELSGATTRVLAADTSGQIVVQTAASARTLLGLGTLALQDSTSVSAAAIFGAIINDSNTINARSDRFTIKDSTTSTKQVAFDVATVAASTTRTFTFPNANGVLVLQTGAQSLSNKTLNTTNTITVFDSLFTLQDNTDNTKQGVFDLSGITTGNTRTIIWPNSNGTMALTSDIATTAALTSAILQGIVIESAGSIYGYQSKLNVQVTAYTLVSSDTGKTIMVNNATSTIITLPNSMQPGYNATLIQQGAGVIQFTAATSSTINQRQSFTKSAGQYAAVGLIVSENSNGTAAHYILSGDMA